MAVLGSNVMIDLHPTPDTDVDSVRGAVQENGRVDPRLAEQLRDVLGETTEEILEARDAPDYSVTVDLEFVDERVPGAPRERISARLDVEAEDEDALSTVSDAVGPPQRARLADIAETRVREHLAEGGLAEVVETTVIVTPIEFR